MKRTLGFVILVAGAGLYLGLARGERGEDTESPGKDARALQESLQKIVAQTEPSIACILVSRSKLYERFGAKPPAPEAGKLGGFNYDYSRINRTRENEEWLKLALKLDLSSRTFVPESYGSGVVVDAKNRLVLTNYHVVRGAMKLYVRLPNGQGSYANIHAADPRSDLAVLKLISPVTLKAVEMGDGGKVKKGQMVLTIANPFAAGFRDGCPSASWGIVSNLRRRAPISELHEWRQRKNLHHYGTLIQTDTRINLGCSGGALVDLDGKVIGLTTALAGVTGTDIPGGYAVPVDRPLCRIIDTLKEGKEVEYGFLGVAFYDAHQGKGVQILAVTSNSPAEKAGVKREDRILAVNGIPTPEINDVYLPLASLGPGEEVKLRIARIENGVSRKVSRTATLVKYAVQGPIIASNRRWFRGLRVDYTSLQVQKQGSSGQAISPGVFVCEVKPRGGAAAAGIKIGDVITAVNGKSVKSPKAFYKAVSRSRRKVRLTIRNRPVVVD
jgi:S1-C subfamily serine protease